MNELNNSMKKLSISNPDIIIQQIKKDKNEQIDNNIILKKYNIKVKYQNNIICASKINSNNVKNKIIKMKIEEFDDIFDYDFYIKRQLQTKQILRFFI